MPASPEFRNVTGEVRCPEIGHERDAKQPGRPNGDVAIPAEVSIDLEGKVHSSKNQRRAAVLVMVVKHVIHKNGASVGNDDFFEKAPQDQLQPTGGEVRIELAPTLDLGKQGRSPFNGPCDELRKKTDECRKVNQVPCGIQLSPVDVDRIAQRLKGVKADSDRKHNVEGRNMHRNAERLPRLYPRLYEKVGVLEVAEQP